MSKRILIFGSGSAAKDFLSAISHDVEVIGLVDSDISRIGNIVEGYPVLDFASVDHNSIDYIVIASRAVDEIRDRLISQGVIEGKIIAFYPSFSKKLYAESNRDIRVMNEILGMSVPLIGLSSMYLDPEGVDGRTDEGPHDFVRDKSFSLAARQIINRGVEGAVAELGVYQGDQAKLINSLFPARTLYLFDTFSGFSQNDLGSEADHGFSNAVLGDFENTSLSLVMGKLPHPDNVKAFPGYFPDTAIGLDEKFAFVSLDVDLYEPTLAGLNWFYDRLNPGGYIFVHDYNNRRYLGVRGAVDAFVRDRGACCIPIADFAGSVIIAR